MELAVGGVVVSQLWLGRAKAALGGADIRLISVAGFPLGAVETVLKTREAELAFDQGADEVDFVMPIGALRGGDHERVAKEFSAMVALSRSRRKTLKVILECGLLAEIEIRIACRLAVEAGIEYVKTSTGFGPRGATVEDVRLLSEAVAGRARVKAAGGIRTFAQARALLDAGASRLGTSTAASILREGGAERP
jgi:deoxyribose-phosphate aldolase